MKLLKEYIAKLVNESFESSDEIILKLKSKEVIGNYTRLNYDIVENGEIVGNILIDVIKNEVIIQSINSFKKNIGTKAIKLLKEKYPNKILKGDAKQDSIGFWRKIGVSFDFENPKENYDDDSGDLIPFIIK